MAKTYEQIFDEYNLYSNRATNVGMGIQGALAVGSYFGGEAIKKNFRYDKQGHVSPGSVNLTTYNVRDAAVRDLNRAFISSVNASREMGREVNPSLLSGYSRGIQSIDEQQGKLFTETRNREEMLGFDSREKTKVVNAGIDARNAEMESKMNIAKAGQDARTLNTVSQMVANITNMQSKNAANQFDSALKAKGYTDIEIAKREKEEARIEKATETENALKMQEAIDAGIDIEALMGTSAQITAAAGGYGKYPFYKTERDRFDGKLVGGENLKREGALTSGDMQVGGALAGVTGLYMPVDRSGLGQNLFAQEGFQQPDLSVNKGQMSFIDTKPSLFNYNLSSDVIPKTELQQGFNPGGPVSKGTTSAYALQEMMRRRLELTRPHQFRHPLDGRPVEPYSFGGLSPLRD